MSEPANKAQLPKSWTLTTLGEIHHDRSTSINPINYPEKTFELYSVPSFDNLKPEIKLGKEIGSNKITVEEDTVLLCKINPRINRVWIVNSISQNKKIASTEWIPFFKVTGINPKYLGYFMQKNDFKNYLASNASGVGGSLMRVRTATLKKYPFPLAPTSEQCRIVIRLEDFFSRLDAGVKVLRRVQAQLKLYRQSVLKYAFGGKLTEEWRRAHKDQLEPAEKLLERIRQERRRDPKYKELPPIDVSELPPLPESWTWIRIGEISDKIHYGYTASSSPRPIGPKMLRITDIQADAVNWNEVPYCKIDEDIKEKYLLRDGDLVFARTGATVGKSFLIKGNIPEAVFASYLIRIILSKVVKNEFVYNFFHSPLYWLQIRKQQIGIGQPNVNSQMLAKIVLPFPSLDEQNRIVEEIESRLSIADNTQKMLENSIQQSERLRQSILKLAFEGRLVPQDPNDEPAERLLERIRAERAKAKAGKAQNKASGKSGQLELTDYV